MAHRTGVLRAATAGVHVVRLQVNWCVGPAGWPSGELDSGDAQSTETLQRGVRTRTLFNQRPAQVTEPGCLTGQGGVSLPGGRPRLPGR